jgi:CheY-like chemotaxis protein
MRPDEAVRRLLADAPEDGVCDACLARVCEASLSEIRQIVSTLVLVDKSCGRGVFCARCGEGAAIVLMRCTYCRQPISVREPTSPFDDGVVHTSCLGLVAETTMRAAHDGHGPTPTRAKTSARESVARSLVVVVDDDISVRRGLSRLLAAAGYRVSAFGSGRELLEWLAADTPSCLVLDVRMPGLNGVALHETLRAAGQQIPVVFITGDVEIPATTRATTGASVAILSKPVDDDELFAAVHRLIAASEDRSDLADPPEH